MAIHAPPIRRSDRLALAGLELLATTRPFTFAEAREHARLALLMESARGKPGCECKP